MAALDPVLGQAPAALITSALGDLGNLVRRQEAESLDHDTFLELTRSMRRKLKAARVAACAGVDCEELEEIGDALALLLDTGELKRGSALQPRLPEGVNRARFIGQFTVIDGGLATPSDHTPKGAA